MTLESAVPRPLPPLAEDAHKGVAGRVLSLAGSPDMPGAGVLAARAAVRAGAGLVTAALRADDARGTLESALVATCPEATLLRLEAGRFEPAFAPGVFHARLVGPGLGRDAWARAALEACLAGGRDDPLVVDADGLNLLAGEPERVRGRPGPVLLTPHPGEARRLAGSDVPRDAEGRRAFAAELARRAGALVCLKGAGSVVTDGRRVWVNSTGNAGLATGGTGDVLSGIALAYLAHAVNAGGESWDAFDAACQAVWVHGRAGDLAARTLGRRAVSAGALIAHLPEAQKELEAAGGS